MQETEELKGVEKGMRERLISEITKDQANPQRHERDADGVGEGDVKARPAYDEGNSVKRDIGVFVHLAAAGAERKFLFSMGSTWRWTHISGRLTLEVCESGAVALHAPYAQVICVGGPQTIFRDGSWK